MPTSLRSLRRRIGSAISFFDAELSYYAASLSFYTIFAFIPLLLVALSITTRFPGFEEHFSDLRDFILSQLLPANVDVAGQFLSTFLDDISRLGMVGAIYIAITSVLFFKNYQHIASRIFRTVPRDFWSSVTTYWTLMTLMPLGLAASLYFTTRAQIALQAYGLDIGLLIPYLIIWATFFVIFVISANKPLQTRNALVTSFLTAVAWNVTKELFVAYAVIGKAYTTIYGSFSIVLLFFLWIYISWIILLYGMRLCEGFHTVFDIHEQ
ncbi:YihY family inner membrane protein [Desulfurispira natronophila]|nr:YihY family inner membrane protein [Desulfurispira natronophila]